MLFKPSIDNDRALGREDNCFYLSSSVKPFSFGVKDLVPDPEVKKASLRLENGENIEYIQTQLGHATPAITLNVYAHLMRDRNPEAACRLENAVVGENGSKMVARKGKGLRSKTITL